MARTVFANEDLKRNIFSFGYPEHREFMKSLTESLKVDCMPFIRMYKENCNDRCMGKYILDEYTESEILSSIHYFNRCRCCTRHSHYQPRFEIVDGITAIYMDTHYTHYNNHKNVCECRCQTIARHMINAYCEYTGITCHQFLLFDMLP